ncbi:secreted RxLR effector protein 161-like [Cicer arietinum]|uniref:secreted RxLR effector protein 161-like n=1 Tax=Cicer arietinum TaxID=3827 RepID=UPI003CC62C61
MIGSLLYLIANRPNIVFTVGLCARFQAALKESHLTAIKQIFRHLVGTTDLGLRYRKCSHFDLLAYCYVDYAGDKIERKSTSGSYQFLGEALISWSCRKQNTIALSTTEVEYVSAANCCSQVLWIKYQLEDISLADIFTKPLVDDSFNLIKEKLQIVKTENNNQSLFFRHQSPFFKNHSPLRRHFLSCTKKTNLGI